MEGQNIQTQDEGVRDNQQSAVDNEADNNVSKTLPNSSVLTRDSGIISDLLSMSAHMELEKNSSTTGELTEVQRLRLLEKRIQKGKEELERRKRMQAQQAQEQAQQAQQAQQTQQAPQTPINNATTEPITSATVETETPTETTKTTETEAATATTKALTLAQPTILSDNSNDITPVNDCDNYPNSPITTSPHNTPKVSQEIANGRRNSTNSNTSKATIPFQIEGFDECDQQLLRDGYRLDELTDNEETDILLPKHHPHYKLFSSTAVQVAYNRLNCIPTTYLMDTIGGACRGGRKPLPQSMAAANQLEKRSKGIINNSLFEDVPSPLSNEEGLSQAHCSCIIS